MFNEIKLMTINEAIGATIAQYMFRFGVSRADLGAVLGVAGANVSLRLHGKSKWTAEDLISVACYFDVDLDDLRPTPDGMGGWIPAPFIPGKAKAPAAKATEANEVVAGTGFEPATSGL